MAKTIIFDIGGVLVHLNWKNICEPLTALSDLSAADVRREVQNGPIVESSMLGQLTPQEFHQALCAKIHVNLPFGEFVEIWNSLLSENVEIPPLVDELGTGHPLVIASNTEPTHFAYTKDNFGVLQAFDHFYLSYEMGLLKPDPAYFQHVLNGLQTEPNDCVFVDDRPENVESARLLGINALVFESVDKLRADLEAVL